MMCCSVGHRKRDRLTSEVGVSVGAPVTMQKQAVANGDATLQQPPVTLNVENKATRRRTVIAARLRRAVAANKQTGRAARHPSLETQKSRDMVEARLSKIQSTFKMAITMMQRRRLGTLPPGLPPDWPPLGLAHMA